MKKIITSLFTIIVMGAITVAATQAYFTSSAEVVGNTFTTGVLDISLGKTSQLIVYQNIYPGWHYQDSGHWGAWVDGENPKDLKIINSGSLPLKYRMKAELMDIPSDNSLLDDLLVRVSINRGKGGSWNSLYSGTLRGLLSFITVETNFETTGHSGWYGEGQLIRFDAALPPTSGNSVQGKTVNFNLIFEATQVTNPGWTE
jgi:predicted ribosomally synthesized peptide with SipW-like signal peptide